MYNFATLGLEERITSLGIRTVLISSIIIVLLTAIAAGLQHKKKILNKLKLPLFIGIAGTMVVSTVILFASTIYLNVNSESGGPVHWHTDIEFWACGAELELRDPIGALSNKIGTSTYHEHNDKRIHLEGVVVEKAYDASLEKFMDVTGGFFTSNSIAVPVNDNFDEWFATEEHSDGDISSLEVRDSLRQYSKKDGENRTYLEFTNGQTCSGQVAEVQTFKISYDKTTETYRQEKLENGASYIMRDESVVPPGDCVIVEFDITKDRTDKLCEQYGVRDTKRCVAFGVEEYNPDLCNIREVTTGEGN